MPFGDDAYVEWIAPGLKQAGAIRIGDCILIHAAPERIDAQVWREQLRRVRQSRPVDVVVPVMRSSAHAGHDDETLSRKLSNLASDLRWAAPVVFMHSVVADGSLPEPIHVVGALMDVPLRADAQACADRLMHSLGELELATADAGIRLCSEDRLVLYLAQVSAYMGAQRERIVKVWQTACASKWRRAPLAGVLFAPTFESNSFPKQAEGTVSASGDFIPAVPVQPAALMPLWREVAARVDPCKGKRTGVHCPTMLAAAVFTAAVLSCVAMTASFIGNQVTLHDARQAVDAALIAKPGSASALRTQLELQKQMETLEYRLQHGAPWYLRSGLNRDRELLAALWQPYAIVAARNLRDPITQRLDASLGQLAQSRADSLPSAQEQKRDYDALKTYLMLAQPQHADPAFLTQHLQQQWPVLADMQTGEWLDLSQHLSAFYASHLRAHPEWKSSASTDLVAASRNQLINQIGLQYSDDTLYRSVIEQAKGKYADIGLASLLNGADARGLFSTTQTVPGVYTRAAWDGMIDEAITKAAKEGRVGADWVLADEHAARVPGADLEAHQDIEEVKQRLRARYFAEYTAAWQAMLNSLQWQSATNLSGAITQLARLTDAQTSPLIALMKSVQYQAQAGRASQALTDTLVRRAQDLIGNGTGIPTEAVVNPLDKPFGPLLALMGDDVVTGAAGADGKANGKQGKNAVDFSGVSLSHFLTVATTMRLKLQQIATSADAQAMARQMAQAVFQGKLSELTQARDDAALTAASLGAQWSSFGEAVFARPLDVAWQTILQPAAASLNDAWRTAVAAPFASSFDGHYPFSDTDADASFVELGRYIKPDTGLISRFVITELAGILRPQGSAWMPNELAPQALQFDPEFLAALRQLSTLGAQLYAQGDASYRLQIMANPTPEVTRSILTVDGTKIEYYNQLETFTPIVWPGNGQNGRVMLTWESFTAGTRIAFAANGDWAFMRLLATAQVKALDSTRYALTVNHDSDYPLHYVMKTQVGAGPLDLLKLRGFKMPQRVFIVGKGGALPGTSVLPPLPPGLQ
ncbi:type VI secretion protein VasK [Caballeronia megalochromosomata]|nr:type VI secretion protein VasK [Caballeronia megalochromosomata]